MKNDIFCIREIKNEEIDYICRLIGQIYFLPKLTWETSLSNMAQNGLRSKKWTGIGAYDSQGDLMAYLDYKEKEDMVEIGICFTVEEYRNRHLMGELLHHLMKQYEGIRIEIGTYENNFAMRKCCERLGFTEKLRRTDRVDGSDSIIYESRRI